jgi:predicted esterase
MTPDSLGFVHRFMPGKDSARTLLLLHGTGGDENNLLDLGPMLDPNAARLSPRGKVLEGKMPRFFRRLGEGVFDLEDLRFRTHELADFVTNASDVYGFPPQRVVAAGFSNGANIAASTLLLRPGVLAGAILLRAMIPLEPETLPDLTGVPIFMASGRNDPIVPVENTERLAAMLREAGANVTQYWHDAGHSLTHGELAAARAWLEEQSV